MIYEGGINEKELTLELLETEEKEVLLLQMQSSLVSAVSLPNFKVK